MFSTGVPYSRKSTGWRMNRPPGFPAHGRFRGPLHLINRPVLQHVHLIDAAEDRVAITDDSFHFGQFGVAQWRRREGLDNAGAEGFCTTPPGS